MFSGLYGFRFQLIDLFQFFDVILSQLFQILSLYGVLQGSTKSLPPGLQCFCSI